jgi:hypothetical protein
MDNAHNPYGFRAFERQMSASKHIIGLYVYPIKSLDERKKSSRMVAMYVFVNINGFFEGFLIVLPACLGPR